MLWGYFMKLVVADRLAGYIDMVYGNYESHNGATLLLASALYPFQVYGDLGGYSLIAIGTAKVLGYDVMANFKRPFFATSMSEFWNRWHISLITWFKDYVYTPLSFAFRRYGVWGIVLALMLTFMISGLWHGAAFTFIAWGLLQGLYLSIEAITAKYRMKITTRYGLQRNGWFTVLGIITTFVLFTVSLIFARSDSLQQSFVIFSRIFIEQGNPYLDITTLVFGLGGLMALLLRDFKNEYWPTKQLFFENRLIMIRYAAYLLTLFSILLGGVSTGNQFVYFQF
jgi:D-alanyl-lipoteichoic acid acyltransferase DltB (MBOAT superfamily)